MRNASVSDTLCDLDHHDLLDFWPWARRSDASHSTRRANGIKSLRRIHRHVSLLALARARKVIVAGANWRSPAGARLPTSTGSASPLPSSRAFHSIRREFPAT